MIYYPAQSKEWQTLPRLQLMRFASGQDGSKGMDRCVQSSFPVGAMFVYPARLILTNKILS